MKFIWTAIGRVLYILLWPLLWVYLLVNGDRTRIVVIYKNELLMVQNWLGIGTWGLPGGGVHNTEQPTNSAVRELKEETGLVFSPKSLKPLGRIRTHIAGLKINMICYYLMLDSKPELKTRRGIEILDVKWFKLKKGVPDIKLSADVEQVLKLWNGFEPKK
jgi:8-oxo-dGTP pyrophosphatase MutT (NUDIX family)